MSSKCYEFLSVAGFSTLMSLVTVVLNGKFLIVIVWVKLFRWSNDLNRKVKRVEKDILQISNRNVFLNSGQLKLAFCAQTNARNADLLAVSVGFSTNKRG